MKKNILRQQVQDKANVYNYRKELNKNLIEANKEKNKIKSLNKNKDFNNYEKKYCIKFIEIDDYKQKNNKNNNNKNNIIL
jgi:hypothetical protein